MSKMRMSVVVVVAAVAVAIVWRSELSAQVVKGKSRPLRTSTLMKCVMAPNCGALKKALEAGPADDEAWDTVALHAELLNEVGHVLMADGRCPDETWAEAAKTLQGCSESVLTAIEAKDSAKALEAFGAMTQACAACHKAHRKES